MDTPRFPNHSPNFPDPPDTVPPADSLIVPSGPAGPAGPDNSPSFVPTAPSGLPEVERPDLVDQADTPGANPEATQNYNRYMGFPSPEERPWAASTLTGHLTKLGVARPEVTDDQAETLRQNYAGRHRFYHGPPHGGFVGQPDIPEPIAPLPEAETYDPSAGRLSNRVTLEWAQSSTAVSGTLHDIVYKHVDETDSNGTNAWSADVHGLIGDFARPERAEVDGKAVYRTRLTEAGAADPVTQMVAHVFNVGEEGIATRGGGGDEFDSALVAAKFLEARGADPKTIMASTVAIAATVPFKPAIGQDETGNMTDGHMGELAQRLNTAVLGGYQPDWQDTNDMMLLAVNLANRDIAAFIRPDNLGEVIHNGRGVKLEEIPVLREQVRNMQQLDEAGERSSAAPLLYEWFGSGSGPLSAANVPHFYIPRDAHGNILGPDAAFPPLPVHQEAVHHAEVNSRLSSRFFKANEAGIAFAAAIATCVDEPNAPVPGFVSAIRWEQDALPQSAHFDAFNTEEVMLFNELMHGTSQIALNSAVPSRSPIGGTLFGALGTEGLEALSARIQQIRAQAKAQHIRHPFSDPVIAQEFISEVSGMIGPTNASTIFTQLRRVADHFAPNPVYGNPERSEKIRLVASSLGLAA